jgi:hypothetical protein
MPNPDGINFFCLNLNGEMWMGPFSSMFITANKSFCNNPTIPYAGYSFGGNIIFWDNRYCCDPRSANTNCAYNGDISSTTFYNAGASGERSISHTTRCAFYFSVFGGGLIMQACLQGLYVAGDIVAGQSDRRLKTSIMNIPNALCKINQLNGIYFNWNECACRLLERNTNKREVGFIAQDINKVLPEAVEYAAFDRTNLCSSMSGQDYLTVKYEKITPLLLEGIKELQCEIKELKCQINILNGR